MNRIYLSAPDVRQPERDLLLAAFDSGWLAPIGPDLDAFEDEVAEISQRPYAVGLTSGTAGIHLLLRELGVTSGDEVLVPTFTFVATANPVRYCGATPFFIDSEPATWNLNPDLVAEDLTRRRAYGRPMPKAAVVVDLYGLCADYNRIIPVLGQYDIPLIEDAAEAIGATYRGRPAGSFGHAGVFSFNGNKLITTSSGGMVVTDDRKLAQRIRHLSTQARQPAPHYEHVEVGFNARLSNLLAAVGRGQLQTLPERIARRGEIRSRYEEALGGHPGVGFNPCPVGYTPNHWLTCITIDPLLAGFSSEEFRLHFEKANIETRPTWKPMHLQPLYKDAPRLVDGTSEDIFSSGLCLPSGSGMSDEDVDRIAARISELVSSRT